MSYLVANPEDKFSRDEAHMCSAHDEKTCLTRSVTRQDSKRPAQLKNLATDLDFYL